MMQPDDGYDAWNIQPGRRAARQETSGFNGRISDKDIRLFRIFINVVQCNGFAAAESRLQMSLPSISRYMKDLEVRIGARLCERGKGGFNLTPEGRQIYEASQRLFVDLEDFEDSLRSVNQRPAGIVRLGLCNAVAEPRFLLPAIVSRYHGRYPETQIVISSRKSDLIEQDVANGSLDVGIVFVRRQLEQITYHRFCTETDYLYAAPSHALFANGNQTLQPSDLQDVEYAGYDFAHAMKRMGWMRFSDTRRSRIQSIRSPCWCRAAPMWGFCPTITSNATSGAARC